MKITINAYKTTLCVCVYMYSFTYTLGASYEFWVEEHDSLFLVTLHWQS